jgi:putative membrane protein
VAYATYTCRAAGAVDARGRRLNTARVRRDTGNEALVSALLGWGVNIVALLVIDSIFDSVEIGRWGSVLVGAAVLGIANAIIKPILTLFTLPLIIVTLGLSYFAINVAMLALAEWIAPDFSIDGFWTYVGATVVVWLVNWILNTLLGSLFGGRSRPTVAY